MSWWRRFVLRRNAERELDAELRDHLDRLTADYLAQGLPEGEARRRAAANFGGLQQAKEYCRDVRRASWTGDLATDLRYGLRMLAHQRMFTLVAVMSLALGIGANAAIFTLVDGLLLRSLPVRDPERLVLLDKGSWTNPIWEEIRTRQQQLFAGAVAWGSESLDLASGGQAEPVSGLLVSGDFFDVLGVPMSLGRPMTAANDTHGGPNVGVAVISYGFWQQHFGGDPAAVGKTLTLNRLPFTILGVSGPLFRGPEVGRDFDVAIPIGAISLLKGPSDNRLTGRSTWWLNVIARLRPGQAVEGATDALRAVQPQIRQATLPDRWSEQELKEYLSEGMTFKPAAQGPDYLREQYQKPLMTLMAVVGFVLLIACANIANLMLARANWRRHELTMRLALGASGGRLARQLLTESLLISALGASIGLAFAQWGSRLLVSQLSIESSPVTLDLTPDWRVLAFTTSLAVLTAVLFGTVPAWRARSLAPIEALKEQGRGMARTGRGFLGSPLVVLQIALSLVLIVGAALFVRTFTALAERPLGFDRDPVLLVSLDVSRSARPRAQWPQLFQSLCDAAKAVPGVQSAAQSPITPVSGMMWNDAFEFPDQRQLSERERLSMMNAVTPGWFATYGAHLVAGRDFTSHDSADGPPVAIVNQAFVRKFWKGGNAIGRQLQPSGRPDSIPRPMQIVGVVQDITYDSVRADVPPTVFKPVAQLGDEVFPFGNVAVRATSVAPATLTRSLASALSAVDPDVSLRFRSLADQVNTSLARERLLAMISAFFGVLALLLAGVGLYGVTAYAVSQRRMEIGLRMALGADAPRVLSFVMGRVALLVAVGIAIGAALSAWAGRFIAGLLFGLEPHDPTTLISAAAVLVAVAGLAAWIPAWRATRIDPIVVLREG